ncbi:MUS81 (YDR386W) [Zygosaccharomyces parabailii]|nr:MUS81 (YDR386W) [Zygosaccharomyces parabailii]
MCANAGGMSLPADLKDLYASWLEDFISGLSPKQEQLGLTYEKARRNLMEFESVVYYPRDLKKVKGIGDTIMRRLEKRLKDYCDEIGVAVPQPAAMPSASGTKRGSTALRLCRTDAEGSTEGPPTKKLRKYIPRKRSGGYGILLALLELNAISRGISKDDTIHAAQKYCDHSMSPNFATREFKGAWSAITVLKKHNFVIEEGRPKRYFLSEEGAGMAKILKAADDIKFPNEPEQEEGKLISEVSETYEDSEITANLSELLGSCPATENGEQDLSLLDITFRGLGESTPKSKSTVHMSDGGAKTQTSSPVSRQYRSTSPPLTEEIAPKILKRRFEGTSYELWSKGTYEIYPIIDHREVKSQRDRDFFSNAFTSRGMKCEIRQLALGDIVWIAKNKHNGSEAVLNTIIERKRLDDLAISIRDNRFMEQKSRLEKSGCKNKYYLIEETMGDVVGGMAEALKTSLWLILIYYRFSVIRTTNSDATVEKIQSLQTVLEEEYSKKDLLVIKPHALKNQDDYRCELEKFRIEFEKNKTVECCHNFQCFQEILGKGELVTIGELTIHILMFIKGISIEKAVAVQSVFPTLSHILAAYDGCKSPEEAKLLMFQKLGNAPGAKKITKGLSEKMADVFSKF